MEVQKIVSIETVGTLAIDLGNSTTVIAFQGEEDPKPTLLNLSPLVRTKGEIPSLVFFNQKQDRNLLVGQQILNLSIAEQANMSICSDFKRWIGAADTLNVPRANLLPEKKDGR